MYGADYVNKVILSHLGFNFWNKAFTYSFQFIGQEPSGNNFNEICLDTNLKPHNPMINAGAIMAASLIKPDMNLADRFDFIQSLFRRLAGGLYVGFNNSIYLSERAAADRNFALGNYMMDHDCFPSGIDLKESLEFYFQLCSMETSPNAHAVMAATLANGGICPITGEKVLSPDAVKHTLSLMLSCGMYDYSGQFAFKVGLPAKSGVSGAILLSVPNVMGILIYSPPLDGHGNSFKGLKFCDRLLERFKFHQFDLTSSTKIDPVRHMFEENTAEIMSLLFRATR